MLQKRILSAIIGITLFIWLLLWGKLPFALLITLITLLGINELTEIITTDKFTTRKLLLSLLSLFILFFAYYDITGFSYALFISTVIILFLFEIRHGFSNLINRLGTDLFILIYLAVGISFFIILYGYSAPGFTETTAILLALITTWATDTGAYFTGLKLGKRKLAPRISPNKTLEGALGGAVAAATAAVIFSIILGNFSMLWIIYGILTAVFGILGDLLESSLKREAGIKDSGQIIPGHGGILDRFDSLLFTLPYTYIFLSIFF